MKDARLTEPRRLKRSELLGSSAIRSGSVAIPEPGMAAKVTAGSDRDVPEVKLATFLLNRFIDQGTVGWHTAEQIEMSDDIHTLEIPHTLLDQQNLGADHELTSRACALLCNAIAEHLGQHGGPAIASAATVTKGVYDGEDKSYLMLGIPAEVALGVNMPHDRISEAFRDMLKTHRNAIIAQLPAFHTLLMQEAGTVTSPSSYRS